MPTPINSSSTPYGFLTPKKLRGGHLRPFKTSLAVLAMSILPFTTSTFELSSAYLKSEGAATSVGSFFYGTIKNAGSLGKT